MNKFRLSYCLAVLLSSCQPARSPVISKPLEIQVPVHEKVPAPGNETVQIGIRIAAKQVTIESEGEFELTDILLRKTSVMVAGSYTVTVENGEVLWQQKRAGKKVRLRMKDGEKRLKCNGLGYRGELIIRASQTDNTLTVVNELSIDDYLKGVLPREVVVTWAAESLRVQAVASRTYLASHLGSHGKQGFDLCSDVHCQVYGGTVKEHPRTNEAVDETRDQILVYDNKPIGAFFHSNCGGTTEKISYVWGRDDRPYLPRKKCVFGTKDPRYKWTITLSDDYVIAALTKASLVKGKKIKSIRVQKKSPSGRGEKILVTTDDGSYTLTGNGFRLALHPEKIRSTLFSSIKRHGDGTTFSGQGWGHGVGMCQWGAKGQAEEGKDYREILRFYYPNTEMKLWTRT